MPKSKEFESCNDFLGNEIRVGDFVVGGRAGNTIAFHKVMRIRERRKISHYAGGILIASVKRNIICELVDIETGEYESGYRHKAEPEDLLKLIESQVMQYQLLRN